jgi:aminopeptidase N
MHILSKFLSAFVFLLFNVAVSYGENMPMNNIKVSFDVGHNLLKGESRISLPSGQSTKIELSGLRVLSAKINDRSLAVEPGIETITFNPGTPEDVLNIEYEAEFKSMPETDGSMNPGVVHGNLVGTDGIVLTDGWYPFIDGLSIYNLTAVLPAGFEGISEAEGITIKEAADGSREFSFSFRHPVRDINLIAGKYIVEKDTYNETELYSYFFMEDKELSKAYMEHAKKYLEMYEKLLGKYPFKRFSIVENMLPTGYSMPTFTLLGQDVVRLPFIVETSLGHEILHQWFGNLVYTDHKNGNWSEGITTYLADHKYEEIKGAGRDYRKQALIAFQNYVNDENDFPLKSFSTRTDRASSAIGYGKSAMVFHMLKNISGEDIFYSSLQAFIDKNKFKTAGWDKIREAFESVSGKALDWFFRQWIEEKGIPAIDLRDINLKYIGSKAVVSFEILQQGGKYRIAVPVSLMSKEGEINRVFEIEKESAPFEIETEGSPVELFIDPNYDLFRRLSDKEFPPVISGLLGARKKIFIIPSGKSEEYSALSGFLKKEGFEEKKEEDIKHEYGSRKQAVRNS